MGIFKLIGHLSGYQFFPIRIEITTAILQYQEFNLTGTIFGVLVDQMNWKCWASNGFRLRAENEQNIFRNVMGMFSARHWKTSSSANFSLPAEINPSCSFVLRPSTCSTTKWRKQMRHFGLQNPNASYDSRICFCLQLRLFHLLLRCRPLGARWLWSKPLPPPSGRTVTLPKWGFSLSGFTKRKRGVWDCLQSKRHLSFVMPCTGVVVGSISRLERAENVSLDFLKSWQTRDFTPTRKKTNRSQRANLLRAANIAVG